MVALVIFLGDIMEAATLYVYFVSGFDPGPVFHFRVVEQNFVKFKLSLASSKNLWLKLNLWKW